MLFQEQDIGPLIGLGLTKSQAHLYLNLLRTGKEHASILSKLTKIPRTETYRILGELEEIGLVEKHLVVPYTYQAAPIMLAIQILENKKIAELQENERSLKSLISRFQVTAEVSAEREPSISIVQGKERLINILKNGQDNAQLSVVFVSNFNRWLRIVEYCSENIMMGLARGVSYRGIVESSNGKNIPEDIGLLQKNDNFSLRWEPNFSRKNYVIFDSMQVAFNYSPTKSLADSTTLWTNHPSLVAIFKDNFESRWKELTLSN